MQVAIFRSKIHYWHIAEKKLKNVKTEEVYLGVRSAVHRYGVLECTLLLSKYKNVKLNFNLMINHCTPMKNDSEQMQSYQSVLLNVITYAFLNI